MTYLADKKSYFVLLLIFIILIGGGIFYASTVESKPTQNNVHQQILSNLAPSTTTSAGFSIISLSKIPMFSDISYLNNPDGLWALSVSAGTLLGQKGYVKINAGDAQTSGGKEKPEYDFTVEVKEVKQSCEYAILTTNDWPLYDLKVIEWGEPGLCEMANVPAGSCLSNKWAVTSNGLFMDGTPKVITRNTGGVYSWCAQICMTPLAPVVGKIDNYDVHTIIKTGLYGGKDGQSYEGIIDSKGGENPVTYFPLGPTSSPKGAVLFHGSLNTGTSCGTQTGYTPIYQSITTPEWKLVDSPLYYAYTTKMNQLKGNEACGFKFLAWGCSSDNEWNVIKNSIQSINLAGQSVLSNQVVFGTIYNKGSQTNAIIIHAPQSLVQNPVLTYYLKADWVGVYTPSPKAQIINTGSECFKSGDINANIKVTVKNIGDEQGNFEVSATCPSPFTAGSPITIGLKPADQLDVYIPLRGGAVTQTTTKDCTVVVRSVSGTVTATQKACIDPYKVCQAGTKWCEHSTEIWQCNNDGTASSKIQDCAPNPCVDSNLGPYCKSDPTVCDEDEICESSSGETSTNCKDCSLNLCEGCSEWFFDLFKQKTDRCQEKKVFEKECKWYEIGCQTHNMIMPSWSQSQFCPVVLGMIGMILMMFLLLFILILKKKGKLGGMKTVYTKKTSMSSGLKGWRGK